MKKEGNVLFNDTLNTFYLRLYGIFNTLIKFILWLFMVEHMVKDHSD